MEAVGITEQLYTQQLPYSLEAEQSVLGAILIDPACITRVMEYTAGGCIQNPLLQH